MARHFFLYNQQTGQTLTQQQIAETAREYLFIDDELHADMMASTTADYTGRPYLDSCESILAEAEIERPGIATTIIEAAFAKDAAEARRPVERTRRFLGRVSTGISEMLDPDYDRTYMIPN